MKYYIAVNDKHEGPYEVAQLKMMNISPDTFVWCEGMSEWKKASDVEEIRSVMIASSPSTPPPFPGASAVPPQQPPVATPQPAMQQGVPPKTWLVESILVTLFCCLPFGIVGIIKASETNSAISRGDYSAAANSSKDAGKWTKIGFWVGLAVIVAYILLYAVMGAALIASGSY